MCPRLRPMLAVMISVAILCAYVTAQQTKEQLSPADLVKAVIHNEMNNPEGSQAKWRYVLDKEIGGKQETRDVVETKSGVLDRLISLAGIPLSDAQQRDETKRILQLSNSPEQQRKMEANRRKDAEQCNAFLAMIPDAFVFEYAGQQPGSALHRLVFKPNPTYRPPSWEGKILHQMTGEMWVDTEQMRLVSISGQLLNDIKFAGGLLGHLEKGGTFFVKRAQLEPGQWETIAMQVNMKGKALLFKTLSVQQKEVHRSFERVSPDLTIADAAGLLLKQSLIAANR